MAVLTESIERARRSGELDLIATAVEFPGYRRQLAIQLEAWSREERSIDAPAPGDSVEMAEEWAVFRHYRQTLRRLGAEDPAGWAGWASRALAKQPPDELRQLGHLFVIDPIAPGRPGWRLLDYCRQHARSMTVTLPYDPEPTLKELYATTDLARRRFLAWDFIEEAERRDGFSFRGVGLEAIERELFRLDAHERPRLRVDRGQGLQILGGPRGEGVNLLVAREVRALIEGGTLPEEILILVPRLDPDAERLRETLRTWNLPVNAGPGRPLSRNPVISALRLALRLPLESWDASLVVRLLRNGQIRWPDLDLDARFARFEAAAAIHSTRVFRDRNSLKDALERDLGDPAKARSASLALKALEQLASVIDTATGPGPWLIQLDRARRLAEAIGLAHSALEPLWDALDDQGWVLQGLGPAIAEGSWTWAEFVRQVEATIAEVAEPEATSVPEAIRIDAVDRAEGARARVVILANLAERTFPEPDAIDLDRDHGPSSDADTPLNLAYGREMLRFARVASSADERIILAYPTTDLNGETLLPAGFLDELIRRLDDRSAAACIERHARFDPVLFAHPDLARSPADSLVRAVAMAATGHDLEPLRRLADDPGRGEALLGVADAFEVAHRRRVDREFGPYDGRLADARATETIRETFGPDHAFSPSQLETFALCPFQFYQRYVLGLKVVDERQELDDDYASRGSDVHRVLEEIHGQAQAQNEANLIPRLGVLIETQMRVEFEQHDGRPATVPQVLKEIGTRRTEKALERYVGQYRAYAALSESEPTPHRFEVVFGQQDDDRSSTSLPHLTIGKEGGLVRLQGMIDRIDLVFHDGKLRFRVIDYKTGSNPSGPDVTSGLASQLPLYALAVERLVFPAGEFEFHDSGYWSLPKKGFKPVKLDDWPAYREKLSTFVLALVDRIRGGVFPIESQKKECRKYCDYHASCRVGEVRMVGKVWADRPTMREEP